MSRRNILQGTIGLVIVVCGLFFSLAYAGTTHAATRASVSPQACQSPTSWQVLTSDTKKPVYTIAQSQITVEVHVALEGAIDDQGCKLMRSELTVSFVKCIGPICHVNGTAQAYFVNSSGNRTYSQPDSGCVGNCDGFTELDIATVWLPVNVGAAGGTFAVSGFPTVVVGTAEETF